MNDPSDSRDKGMRATNKRKQTLMSLLDALAELSKDGELDGFRTSRPRCLHIPTSAMRFVEPAYGVE